MFVCFDKIEPGSYLTLIRGRIASPLWIQGNTATEGWFTWSIKPSSSSFNAIVFSFPQVQSLDPSLECQDSDSTNMLIVRSGDSLDSPTVGAYCLNAVPETLKVFSTAARLEFYTPSSMMYGFLATYEACKLQAFLINPDFSLQFQALNQHQSPLKNKCQIKSPNMILLDDWTSPLHCESKWTSRLRLLVLHSYQLYLIRVPLPCYCLSLLPLCRCFPFQLY